MMTFVLVREGKRPDGRLPSRQDKSHRSIDSRKIMTCGGMSGRNVMFKNGTRTAIIMWLLGASFAFADERTDSFKYRSGSDYNECVFGEAQCGIDGKDADYFPSRLTRHMPAVADLA